MHRGYHPGMWESMHVQNCLWANPSCAALLPPPSLLSPPTFLTPQPPHENQSHNCLKKNGMQGQTGAMSAPNPPTPPPGGEGGGPAGKEVSSDATETASENQQVIDVFGNDFAPAVITLALLMLNMLSGMSTSYGV